MDSSSTTTAKLVNALTNGVTNNYCVVASDALVVAEYFLLLEAEVKYFWSTRLTGATALFYASRYISLVYALYTFVDKLVPTTSKSCIAVPETADALDFSRNAIWAAFSALRTLALLKLRFPNNEWLARATSLFVFLLSMVPFGVSFSGYAFTVPAEVAPGVCADAITWSPELSMKLAIGSRTCLITADLLVIGVTWYTLVWTDGRHTHSQSKRSTFSDVLITDGVLCFVALCIMNVLHVALTVSAITDPSSGHSYVTVFTQPITSIFVSRFLIHLQRANGEASEDKASSNSDARAGQCSTIRFGRTMGSLAYVSGDSRGHERGVDEENGEHECSERGGSMH